MSKLYVPDGAWLVCSKGMKKQQIKVTSQNKVVIAGGKLKATIGDKPGGNFICGQMMLAGAIIGAILGALFVAGTILSGGTLAIGAGATMAAAAAGGAAVGGLASLIPSICGMLLGQWIPYDQNVLTQMQPPLLDNSTIPCTLFGGTVMILYSEKAADEFTDLTIGQTTIGVVGTIATAYLMGPAIKALSTSSLSIFNTFKIFGGAAGANYFGMFSLNTLNAYLLNETLTKTKEGIYRLIPTGNGTTLYNYTNGFETNPVDIIRNGTIPVSPEEAKDVKGIIKDVGGAMDMSDKGIGNRTSTYYEQTTYETVRLDDIEEGGARQTSSANRIEGAISGNRPQVDDPYKVIIESDEGGRYQVIEENQMTTNQQYNPYRRNDIGATSQNTFNEFVADQKGRPKFDGDGPQGGGLLMGLIEDASKVISNLILKGQAEDLQKAIQNEEVAARAKITVIAGDD